MIPEGLVVRRFGPGDSYEEMTALLHRAYRELAEMGQRFYATFQDASVTKKRAESGECWVAVLDDELVATITWYTSEQTHGCAWYDRPGIASVGQLGVDPALRKRGIGAHLMDLAERRARESGAEEIALDTSENAKHLIALYERRGYRFIEHAQWDIPNYRSVILSKRLVNQVSGQPLRSIG
jgi:GNAT superfamily N-acetyltransferase